MDGTGEFRSAVVTHLAPVAKKHGLSFERIEDRVFAMRCASVAVKIYFPQCHGYDVTVCLSPNFDSAWNHEGEKGLAWFLGFLGEKDRLPDRIGTFSNGIDQLVSRYAFPLSTVLSRFSKARPDLWNEFDQFYERKAADKMKAHSTKLEFSWLPFTKKRPGQSPEMNK